MGRECPSVNSFLEELSRTDTATLRICFPETTVCEPGTKLTVDESKLEPTLYMRSSELKPPTTRYIAAALDLDAPFPSLARFFPSSSVVGTVLHGLRADLVAGAAGDEVGIMPRMRWDQQWLEKSIGLRQVLAGNYFLTKA